MFNVNVFLQVLLGLLCIALMYGCLIVAKFHQWWPLRLVAGFVAIVAAAAAVGVACA
jgi:uncharacterized membrane protein